MDLFLRLTRVYLSQHRGKLMLVLIAALVSSLSSFTFSYLSKVMVDDVLHVGGDRTSAQTMVRPVGDRSAPQAGFSAEPTRRDGPPPSNSKHQAVQLLVWVFVAYICLRVVLAAVQWGYSYGI